MGFISEIIKNWNLLNKRMNEEKPTPVPALMKIHIGAFDDVRKNSNKLRMNGKSISEIAPTLSAEQRLELAGEIGRAMKCLRAWVDLFYSAFCVSRKFHNP